jgi:hypothetical protein
VNATLVLVSRGALMENQRSRELRTSSYELFIGALSVLSIINLVLLLLPISDQVKQLILVVDVALHSDFLDRLQSSICFGSRQVAVFL